jgi:hypothetical protein
MPRPGTADRGVGRFPVRSTESTLSGTSWVELVSNPSMKQSYRVTRVFGQNTDGDDRSLALAFNKGGTRTIVWVSAVTTAGNCFTQKIAGDEVWELGLILGGTAQSLDARLDAAGTSRIICSFEMLDGED